MGSYQAEADVVAPLADLLWVVAEQSSRLASLESDLRELFDRSEEVVRSQVAERIELDGDLDGVLGLNACAYRRSLELRKRFPVESFSFRA